MRKLFFILSLFISLIASGKPVLLPVQKKFSSIDILAMNFSTPFYKPVAGTVYYMSPTGSNSNNGLSTSTPFLTIEYAVTFLTPGDTLYLRGGTYTSAKTTDIVNRFYIQNVSGTSTDSIFIKNYPGETVVFDLSTPTVPGTAGDGPVGLKIQDCDWLHVEGIRVTGLAQNPANINSPAGLILYDSDNITLERIEVDNIGGYGLYIQGTMPGGQEPGDGCQNVLVYNCDAHHNGDSFSGWGGANGFNITGGDLSTNIRFKGCRAWWNSDDGFDLYSVDSDVIYEDCWAFWNGYQPGTFLTAGDGMGFKLGPNNTNQAGTTLRRLYKCVSFENRRFNFDQNVSNNITCTFEVYNCTSYDGRDGQSFFFGGNTSIAQKFKNNIAVQPNTVNGTEIQSGANVSNNTWNGGVTANTSDFISISSIGMDGPRQADGSLPVTNFLRLVEGSDLINAGTNVGLPFNGAAPDMGAFETGGNLAPSANAGSNQSITLPTSQVSLSGSGTDVDGSISSYAWTKISGTGGTITSPSSQNTTVTGLSEGSYTFRLTVTDNNGATGTDDMTVTVNAAPAPGNNLIRIKGKKVRKL